MAGLFGLFDHEKAGPGVPKDGPKKKSIVVFFEMFFRNFWKFITINLVYWLISIPVFTNGMASVGITNVARNTARDKHSFGLSDFFETIRKNLKQSIIAGIINTVLYAFMFFDLWFFWASEGTFGVVGTGITFAILITFTMMTYYLWTLIITFDFTLKQAYKNSFKFVFLNFKYSFLCFFVNVLILALNVAIVLFVGKFWVFALLIEVVCLLCVYPAFNALLIQFCTFPSIKKYIIDPYYAEHPEEDIEKRKSLGLEVEEKMPQKEKGDLEDEEDDGVIFND